MILSHTGKTGPILGVTSSFVDFDELPKKITEEPWENEHDHPKFLGKHSVLFFLGDRRPSSSLEFPVLVSQTASLFMVGTPSLMI